MRGTRGTLLSRTHSVFAKYDLCQDRPLSREARSKVGIAGLPPRLEAGSASGNEVLNLEAIANAPVRTEPLNFFLAPGVLGAVDLAAVRADFPQIAEAGVFALSELIYGPAFGELIAELQTPTFRFIIAKKYGVELSDESVMISVRGWERHDADSAEPEQHDEFVTCLLYLNKICDDRGGKLRVLKSTNGQSDGVAEIPLSGGTLASFLTSEGSQLGHEPCEGEIRCLRLSWAKKLVDQRSDSEGCVLQPHQFIQTGGA